MKILAITTTALLFAISAYAQITTITTKEKEVPVDVQKYDSLESLDYDNAPLHKGQTLFLKKMDFIGVSILKSLIGLGAAIICTNQSLGKKAEK